MMDYYDGLSDTSFGFSPSGTRSTFNYATYVYMSMRSTLDSIKTLLKAGHITDAFVLIRKLFDTALVEIYLEVVRADNYQNQGRIRGTGTFIHSLYTNKHNLFPQELLSKCSLS